MSKRGKKVRFHGAFSSKTKAIRKERSVSNSFIKKTRIKGNIRYMVLTRRKG